MAASWKTLRVFISSTFRDMQAERDHLVRFVFPKLREELLKRRIHLIEVDLRWGVTSDQDAVSICREVIDECHPRFMGMLGGRYGWIPEGHERSITEDEVHYGVLKRDTEMWGNAFFYFRKEESTASIVEETPGDFREPEASENARKLADLKQSIVNTGLPVFVYGAKWDVQQKRLTGLEAFGNQVFAQLLKNIQDDPELDDHFASSTAIRFDEFAEEREAMVAFIEDRTERYVVGSRQALLDKMTAFTTANSEQNILVIEGEPGSGKSSLLGKVCQSLTSQQSGLIIPHFVGASVGSTNLLCTLRRLCHELGPVDNKHRSSPWNLRELIDLFRQRLVHSASRQRVVLVIDAINQLDSVDNAHGMNWLPRELPPNLRILASSLEHPALEALRSRGDGVRIERLESLRDGDGREIIEGFMRRYNKRLSAEQIGALLCKPDSHLPLYLLTTLEELRTLGTYAEITNRIHELPGEVKKLFGWILMQRLSNDPGFRNAEGRLCGLELAAKFASYLGVSRHGLSQEELIGLLDPGDPMGNVAALLRLLRPYLMHRGKLLDFFHTQFRQAVESEYLQADDQRLAAHRMLATYFHNVADPNREGRWRGDSEHAFSELPHHQVRAQAWPELVTTLENLFFLEAKAGHGLIFDLASDFSDAVKNLPTDHPQNPILALLGEAIQRDILFIAEYPTTVFQCLWNSCWWYDCRQVAEFYETENGHWNHPGEKLHLLLEKWRRDKEAAQPGFPWLRSLLPPNINLGAGLKLLLTGHSSRVSCVIFSPDGLHIATGGGGVDVSGAHGFSEQNERTVQVWDATTGELLSLMYGQDSAITSLAFSPNGKRILSRSLYKKTMVWDALSGASLNTLPEDNEILNGAGHSLEEVSSSEIRSPDGRLLAKCSDKSVMVFDGVSHDTKIASLRRITNGIFSPDRRWIVTSLDSGPLWLWDAKNGVPLKVLRGHRKHVHNVEFSPDGRRLVSSSSDLTVRIWEVESGMELVSISCPEEIRDVCFSPDGLRVGGIIGAKAVGVWDAENGAEVAVMRAPEGVKAICFSPGGQRVASSSTTDGTIRLWDIKSASEVANYQPQTRAGVPDHFNSLAFSPDGRKIASGGMIEVWIWDVASGTELAVLPHPGSIGCHIYRVRYSTDGLRIACAIQNRVYLWDAVNYKLLEELRDTDDVEASLRRVGDVPFRWSSLYQQSWMSSLLETGTGVAIAWLPMSIVQQATHPEGCIWLGEADGNLTLFRIEGSKTIALTNELPPESTKLLIEPKLPDEVVTVRQLKARQRRRNAVLTVVCASLLILMALSIMRLTAQLRIEERRSSVSPISNAVSK